MNEQPVMVFHDVTKVYPLPAGDVTALDHVSFQVNRGEFISSDGAFRIREVYPPEPYGMPRHSNIRRHLYQWIPVPGTCPTRSSPNSGETGSDSYSSISTSSRF